MSQEFDKIFQIIWIFVSTRQIKSIFWCKTWLKLYTVHDHRKVTVVFPTKLLSNRYVPIFKSWLTLFFLPCFFQKEPGTKVINLKYYKNWNESCNFLFWGQIRSYRKFLLSSYFHGQNKWRNISSVHCIVESALKSQLT